MGSTHASNTVRPELVEGLLSSSCGREAEQGFDKLSPSGLGRMVQ
jgi:hypothetical protein